MSQEKIADGQEQAGVGSAPKPFDPNRAAELEKRFGPKLENSYVIGRRTVSIDSGSPVISKVPDRTPEGLTNIGQRREEYTIELPVTIVDPDAPEPFRGVGRWSKYVLQVDGNTGEVTWSSRVDRMYDKEQDKYNYDGPTYQIHQPEVEMLLNTQAVNDAINQIKSYSK